MNRTETPVKPDQLQGATTRRSRLLKDNENKSNAIVLHTSSRVKCAQSPLEQVSKAKRKMMKMGKHELSREERIQKARTIRKFMNKKHHIEAKKEQLRELRILASIGVKGDERKANDSVQFHNRHRTEAF